MINFSRSSGVKFIGMCWRQDGSEQSVMLPIERFSDECKYVLNAGCVARVSSCASECNADRVILFNAAVLHSYVHYHRVATKGLTTCTIPLHRMPRMFLRATKPIPKGTPIVHASIDKWITDANLKLTSSLTTLCSFQCPSFSDERARRAGLRARRELEKEEMDSLSATYTSSTSTTHSSCSFSTSSPTSSSSSQCLSDETIARMSVTAKNRDFVRKLGVVTADANVSYELEKVDFGAPKHFGVVNRSFIPRNAYILEYGGERLEGREGEEREKYYDENREGESNYVFYCSSLPQFW